MQAIGFPGRLQALQESLLAHGGRTPTISSSLIGWASWTGGTPRERPCSAGTGVGGTGALMSRYPLEGYRKKRATYVTLGACFASKSIKLRIPIAIAA